MLQINHRDITKTAFSVFLTWKPLEIRFEEMGDKLGQSSAAEDDVSFSTKFQRPFNWHFYNNKKLIGNNFWVPGVRTSEKRTQKLIDQLEYYIEKTTLDPQNQVIDKLLNVTGRFMHHIQDMSTPSHVVPVYHGPGVEDMYERYGKMYAGKLKTVLSYKWDSLSHHSRFEVFLRPEDIEKENDTWLDVSPTPQNLMDLYCNAAEKTLQYIRDGSLDIFFNGEKKKVPLNTFWQENEGDNRGSSQTIHSFSQGFGTYGSLKNNFGKGSFVVDKNLYEIAPNAYLKVYRDMYRKTVLESLVVLEYIYRRTPLFTKSE